LGKSDGESGNGARAADGEVHPTVKKGPELAIGFAQVHVLSAGAGEHGPEFGKSETGQQTDNSASDPHQKEQPRPAHLIRNLAGGEKDAGADDAARQQKNGVKQR
jgi:hypothetical protein